LGLPLAFANRSTKFGWVAPPTSLLVVETGLVIRATHRIEDASAGEDRLVVERIRGRTFAIVCDGAGNGGRGGLAADLAIAELTRIAREGFVDWMRAFSSVDQLLLKQAAGGETTCVAIEITDTGECRGASVGDSGAWMIPASRTPTELTARQSRLRLGSGQAHAERFKAQLMWQLVVGTDGLFKYIRHRDLPSLARRGVEALVEGVRLKGGGFQDDVAVILVE
jgi:hypothetical protein